MTVSVLLPVYNCPRYVGAAIESILAQSFGDFEFLIIDDGSTDETPHVLDQYSDARIRRIRHENKGLAGTLNVGIGLARGKYITRQDQDDISLPDRLEKQIAHMDAHPECGLLGTWAQILEGDRLSDRYHKHPSDPCTLRYEMLFNNPFVHSSVMLRKSVLDAVGGYSTDPKRQPPEDYELWSRIVCQSEVANLPEVLVRYREIPGSMSRVGPAPFREHLVRICAENLSFASGFAADDPQVVNIAALSHGAVGSVKSRPNFARMREIVLAAVDSISAGGSRETLRQDASNRILALRGLHLANKALIGPLVSSQSPLRTILKRAYRGLQTLSRRIILS